MIADVERALLKAIMTDRDVYFNIHERVYDRLFTSNERRKLYHLIVEQWGLGKKVDHSLIKFHFNEDELPEIRLVWQMDHTGYDVDNVLDILKRSRIERETNQLIDALQMEVDPSRKKQMLLDGAVKISEDRDAKDISFETQMADFMEDMATRINYKREGKLMGIPTGLRDFDDFSGGFQLEELVILAARPGNGKTSLALQMGSHAERMGIPSLIMSMEMSSTHLISKMACADLGFSTKDYRKGNFSDEQLKAVYEWIGAWERRNPQMYIDDSADTTAEGMVERAKKFILTKGVKFIIIDYLQMMNLKMRVNSMEEKIATISRMLKNLAKSHGVVVVALSQLSRGNKDWSKQRPSTTDLKYSGEIEAAADVVGSLWYPHANTNSGDESLYDENYMEFSILKGRSIGTANFQLNFNPQNQRFTERTYEPKKGNYYAEF
jgi:replicative DNA helicase